jgi:hypothetical protein
MVYMPLRQLARFFMGRGNMSAEAWREYQEYRKTVDYFEKEYGPKGFYEMMGKIARLRKQGVDIEAELDKVERQTVGP